MDMICIKEVDETNEREVRRIKLKSDQLNFIESVDECLAEAEEYEEWRPVAIYSNGSIVGFAMYGSFGPNRDTWIDRFMIDKKYQGQGFGRKAMMHLIKRVSKEYEVDIIYLSIVEENKAAYHLYSQLGFEYMHEKDPNGELLFKYELS